MLRCRRAPALLFAVFAAAAMPSAVQGAAAKEATPVVVDIARPAEATRTVPVIGHLVSLRVSEIAAQIAGAVSEVPVEVGDRVEAGAVLAVIAPERLELTVRQLEARLAERRADLAQAEAELRQARITLERVQGLRQSSAFSRAAFDEAQQGVAAREAGVAAARAAIATAEAEAAAARRDLADATVRAPFPGVVTRRDAQVGAYISVGDPVAGLLDDSRIEIEAEVPARWVAALVPGTAVTASIGDAAVPAIVRAVVPQEDPRTRTRTVRLVPRLPLDLGAAIGQSVVLALPQAVGGLPSVPKDAVVSDAEGHTVYIVQDGKAQARRVDLGPAVGDRIQISDGLDGGETVVIRGNERLRTGEAVTVEGATVEGATGGSAVQSATPNES